MSKPVLSLDVSKGSSIATAFIDKGKPLGKPFNVPHTANGSSILIEQLQSLESLTGHQPVVILEATGNYSKPVTYFLQNAGYSVIALNPLQTHELKRRSIRKIKTDAVDAKRIADLYYLEDLNYVHQVNPTVAELKTLCRQYDGFQTQYTEAQLKVQSILDLIFPTYHQVFGKITCDSSLAILKSFPTPENVLSARKEDIISLLSKSNQPTGWSDAIYEKLMAAANNSLSYQVAQQSNIRVLREYIHLLATHKNILTDIRALITATAKSLSGYDLLLTIPGVGDVTAAFIISEIEDIGRFLNEKQLVAYAGLDPSIYESGKYRSANNTISKRGSSYLRKALFQAAAAAIRKHKGTPRNPVLYEFYQSKVQSGKPKMVALTATSNKLLRIIYGMWSKNQPFRG